MDLLRTFHENIDTMTQEEFIKINDQLSTIILKSKQKRSYFSLVLKYYMINKDFEQVETMLIESENPMKRDYFQFIKHLYSIDIDRALHIFSSIIPKYIFLNNDIKYIIENSLFRLLSLLNGYYLTYEIEHSDDIEDQLCFYNPISDPIKILTYISTKFKRKEECIELDDILKDVDIVIDGGSISHTDHGDCNYKYFDHIIKMICKKFTKPLLIIHQRHIKSKIVQATIQKYNINIYVTPSGVYDDYYIIYSIIKNNCYILSHDKFEDHIFEISKYIGDKNNMIKYYIFEKTIGYSNTKIFELPKYSKCIQVTDSHIFVPTKTSFKKFE